MTDFNFTIHADSQVNRKIQKDLDLICSRLHREFSDVLSIVLVGGFGRGEGSFLVDVETIRAINDYDLVVITSSGHTPSNLDSVRVSLANELGIDWVDISILAEDSLRLLPCNVYNYDLKYASVVIDGSKEILRAIPDMQPNQIPVNEAEVFFFTRLWCFLGPYAKNKLCPPRDEKEHLFIGTQMSKAVLACAEISLILEGQYHHRYAERCNRFEKRFGSNGELAQLVLESTRFKLRPSKMLNYDLGERWHVVRRHFLEVGKTLFERKYKRPFKTWRQYVWWYEHSWKTWLLRIWFRWFLRDSRYQKGFDVRVAQLYLLASCEPNKIDESYLSLAKKRILAIKPDAPPLRTWGDACDLVVKLRMQF